MTWNYQAIKLTEHGTTTYRIHSVFHDEDGEITDWTVDPTWAQGETLEELKADLTTMLHDASKRPVLDMEELCKLFLTGQGKP